MQDKHNFKHPELCQAIFDTAVDPIIIIDRIGTIQTFNPAAQDLFGYHASEVNGKNVRILMPEPNKSKHDTYLKNYLDTGKRKIIGIGRETMARRKNGHTFPMHLAVSEVKVEDEIFFVGFIRDLSDVRNLQNMVVTQSERERAEIGQDLHDVLAQQLTALTLLTKTIQKKMELEASPLGKLAGDIVDLSQKAMEEARRLSHGLYPIELEKHGLISALSELCDNTETLWETPCRLHTQITHMPLDKSVALHLYRIAQEAITNAIRHGEADKIDVILSEMPEHFEMEIRDNGCGMPDKIQPGLGTSIMQYRSNLIGAEHYVLSKKDAGVSIICRLPQNDQPG